MFNVKHFVNGKFSSTSGPFRLESFAFADIVTTAISHIYHDLKENGLSEQDCLVQTDSVREKLHGAKESEYQNTINWLNLYPYKGNKFTFELVGSDKNLEQFLISIGMELIPNPVGLLDIPDNPQIYFPKTKANRWKLFQR